MTDGKKLLKLGGAMAMATLGIDRLFRNLNRRKITVIMYHGVTRIDYQPPVWTQLPVELFREQIMFLKERYRVLHLHEFVSIIRNEMPLPDHSVLITFDDGLKNNYRVAFPVLREARVPAAVFLTSEYIDTDRILWFDELYLYLQQGWADSAFKTILNEFEIELDVQDLTHAYYQLAERLKRSSSEFRARFVASLRERFPLEETPRLEDFRHLSWNEIDEMQDSGLVEFGLHTANHRILTRLRTEELETEVRQARSYLEQKLDRPMMTFCYPNGVPGQDFNDEHMHYLERIGFDCAFSTENRLFDPTKDNRFSIGRVAVGNDLTAQRHFFRLNAAGVQPVVCGLLRKLLKRNWSCEI